ncbi:HNH endonuclease [Vibrio phage River4]|uniref:HNH endonuclease n=1 Tax=Vibrio phage River4 TaxID=2736288 RepID=A0A6M9Z015_9CAUD|nr:HNH endonuclease [Vibrio phage River4]QKN84706.1 HNH endonuclease [Vibrio phage River4]
MLAKEVWKIVPNTDDKYIINSKGIVKNANRGNILKHYYTGKGYATVSLCNKNRLVHLIVAELFLDEKPFEGAEVNHIDGNKANPSVENLEWNTSSENQKHAISTGLAKIGSKRSTSKLKEEQVFEIKHRLKYTNDSMAAIGRDYGVSHAPIRQIKIGRAWNHVRWPDTPQDRVL